MSIFNITDFNRQHNSETDHQLNGNEAICEAIIKKTATPLKSIKIFTPDFEPDLYNNDFFRENLIGLIKGNRHAQIDILVNDLSWTSHQSHKILQLAQKLTSAIQIKTTPEEYKEITCSFILLDQQYFIFKNDSSRQSAIYANCKNRADKLLEFFIPAWEQAALAVESKQIYI